MYNGRQGHGASGRQTPATDPTNHGVWGDGMGGVQFSDGKGPAPAGDREWRPGDFTQPSVPAWASKSRKEIVP